MNRRTLIAAAASVALVAACSQQGVVYQVPVAEARQTLLATELPPLVFGGDPPVAEVKATGDQEIAWIAKQNDVELFRYVALVTEAGPKATRVKLEMKGAQGAATGDLDKRLKDNPRIRDMYMVAMTERIASALEHRPFEMSRIYPALTAASMANMGKLNASADAAAAASEKQARETMEKAYRDEAEGRR